jgi:hypothetical protein
LWYRLLPNPTYPLGVLLSSVLVCFPLVLLLIGFFRQKSETVSRVRIFCLGGILLVMYAGSLLVSVKIGGGSNLHNLDAFLLLLLVTSGYAFFDRVSQENDAQQPVFKPAGVLTLLAILMPVLFALDMNPVNPPPTMNEAREAVMTVRDAVDAVAGQGGDVLFISERQLIVFPYIQGVRLVPDYEKVFLMEMAMSNNRNYLESFYANLMDHRYALIVSEPLKAVYKGPEYSFGEENDVWVKRVVEPILCYYQPQTTLREVQTELLVPKTVGEDCQ